jgi:drug/metabolite transporter (DMT)-like permease
LTVLTLIAIAVLLEVGGQLFYKSGINHLPETRGSLRDWRAIISFLYAAATNWRVLLGVGIYTVQVLVYWLVLARMDVSYAFPLMSTSYLVLMFGSAMFLHERVTTTRWIGAVAVMFGVFLIIRSAPLPK